MQVKMELDIKNKIWQAVPIFFCRQFVDTANNETYAYLEMIIKYMCPILFLHYQCTNTSP